MKTNPEKMRALNERIDPMRGRNVFQEYQRALRINTLLTTLALYASGFFVVAVSVAIYGEITKPIPVKRGLDPIGRVYEIKKRENIVTPQEQVVRNNGK